MVMIMEKNKTNTICEKEVSPYKILLGAIYKQLIDDALPYKTYKVIKKQLKEHPEEFGYQRKYKILYYAQIASKARRFIFSNKLEELISGTKSIDTSFELEADYFRRKYIELENEFDSGKLKKVYNITERRV